MMEELSHTLDFSYRRNGALVLCFDEADRVHLQELYDRGIANGVEGLEILEKEALRAMEPAVTQEAVAALYAPSSGIVCPFGLTIALAENACENGAEFRMNCQVQSLRRAGDHFVLVTDQGELESRAVINAAGVYGDVLHNQICENKLRIVPRKGEYCLLDRKDGTLVDHTIFQLPGKLRGANPRDAEEPARIAVLLKELIARLFIRDAFVLVNIGFHDIGGHLIHGCAGVVHQ